MKIAFIISMYTEIEQVHKSVNAIKKEGCPIIVIQSDPHDSKKILNKESVDYYKMFPDFAGSQENYLDERADTKVGGSSAVKAIIRNFNHAFKISKDFDVDWWVVILGDVTISSLKGIKKIIKNMIIKNKDIGITRAVGQVFLDNSNNLIRIQKSDTTDFMSQFFIVKLNLIKNGLFNNMKITNRFGGEQCVGDEVVRYCKESGTEFGNICYIISNYAYPKFIDGVRYNPDRTVLPRYIDGVVNALRRLKVG